MIMDVCRFFVQLSPFDGGISIDFIDFLRREKIVLFYSISIRLAH